MRSFSPADAAAWITETATAFMESPANDLYMPTGAEPAFDPPLMGFAAGDDPLWTAYKQHVGEFHWTPEEAFALGFPDDPAPARELFVISWVLPQTRRTKADHRRETKLPAERWARARIMGEEYVHAALYSHMVAELAKQGIRAVAPVKLPEWRGMESDAFVFASTWSERHAAHAAGLGTFGLCDGLITPAGKAMRTGSVVVRHSLPVTPRPYAGHQEYCLFYNSGACGVCVKRCPADALSLEGHDKRRCRAYLHEVTAPYVEATWKFKGYGCGLCQVGVPCESRIPPVRVRRGEPRDKNGP